MLCVAAYIYWIQNMASAIYAIDEIRIAHPGVDEYIRTVGRRRFQEKSRYIGIRNELGYNEIEENDGFIEISSKSPFDLMTKDSPLYPEVGEQIAM